MSVTPFFSTALGSIWHGDCLSLMSDIPDQSVDFVLCDLPFGSTKCKWDVRLPFDLLWTEYNRVAKKNAVFALFGTEPFSSYLRLSNINNYRYDFIWEKERPSNFACAKYQPLRYTENISIFYRQTPLYNPQMVVGKKNNSNCKGIRNKSNESTLPNATRSYQNNPDSNLKYPKNILQFERGIKQVHPTQKPVLLFEYLIKTYTNDGDLVLDNCAGSFTTAVAAENTNRRWLCIEQELKYCEVGVQRLI